jgi:PAS domain S-box-containing protein
MMSGILTGLLTCGQDDSDAAAEDALRSAAEFIGSDHAFFAVAASDRGTWSVMYEWCAPPLAPVKSHYQDMPFGTLPWNENTLLNAAVIRLDDVDDLPAGATTERAFFEAEGARSVLTVPITGMAGLISGVCGLHAHARHVRWCDDDVMRLSIVGKAIANAIERRRAEEETRKKLEELTVLNAVALVAVDADDEETLVSRASAVVREALFPDDSGVLLVDEGAGVLRYSPSYSASVGDPDRTPIPLGTGITGMVALTGAGSRVDDVSANPNYLERLAGMRSEICVPLKLGATVIGVLNAESHRPAAFTESDEELLATLAGQLASAIGRLRAAAAHRESEERTRRLADAAFEGIGITHNGRIVDANERLAEMFGYRAEEMIGREVMEFVAPDDAPMVAEFVRAGKDDVYEHLAIRKDGSTFPVETQGRPLGTGAAGMRVVAVRDITERRRAEQRIRQLLDHLELSNEELAQAYDTTLEGWSRALELRDRETQGHSARVVELTLAVGRSLGMSGEELVHMRRGTLLHDIGKMGIPDSILLKPGPLDADEQVVMRRHPTLAYEMLAPISFLRPALDIPYCHHERWDGSGYPRGLAGEAIPLAARIFAVVDVWDGLSHPRPYREAWPSGRVRAYLAAESGRQFDPRVIDAFFALIDAFEAGRTPA